MANWTSYPKPIKEALTILKSPLKLPITSSYNRQQLVFLEICSLVAMATSLHFDVLMQHQTLRFMVFFTDLPITILKIL